MVDLGDIVSELGRHLLARREIDLNGEHECRDFLDRVDVPTSERDILDPHAIRCSRQPADRHKSADQIIADRLPHPHLRATLEEEIYMTQEFDSVLLRTPSRRACSRGTSSTNSSATLD